MTETSGRLCVIDGLDGAGKTIQTGNLILRLRKELPGRQIMARDFPRYDHPSSYSIRKYLRKEEFTKGYREELGGDPYGPSLAYAIDRMDAAHSLEGEDGPNMADFLSLGGIIISNRYTQSNIGYQASKISDSTERVRFIEWLYNMEYRLLKIPRPTVVVFLDLPPALARQAKLAQLATTGKEPDQHEANPQTFFRAQMAYREVAALFPEEWRVVDMMVADGSRRKTTEEVAEDVYKVVRPFLD